MGIKRDPADDAFSKALRLSRGMSCEHCGRSSGQMDCAHIFGRRFKSVRWDTLNALCLCTTCHRRFTESPIDFLDWMRGYLGQGYLDILNEKRNRVQKTNPQYRKAVAKHYREQIKLLEAGPHTLVSYQ